MSDMVQEIEWLECDDGKTRYEVGAIPNAHTVKVLEIGQHAPQGPGDVWFYQVIFEDQSCVRVYNMTKVYIGKPKKTLIQPEKPKIIT